MTRTIRLLLAYDGTSFRGWADQRKPSIRTIEGELTEVLTAVLREPVRLSVAGRTDAGVHARGQVASFRTTTTLPAAKVRDAINGFIAPEVVCLEAADVSERFDARYSASARLYRYRIDTGAVPDPFTARFVWHRPGWLDVRAMRAGARHVAGVHDFATFCRHPGVGKSTVRDLQRVSVAAVGERVELGFRANAFLHQMVRSLTGTLVLVGAGKLTPAELKDLLEARDRVGTGNLAPARGLTLERVVFGAQAAQASFDGARAPRVP